MKSGVAITTASISFTVASISLFETNAGNSQHRVREDLSLDTAADEGDVNGVGVGSGSDVCSAGDVGGRRDDGAELRAGAEETPAGESGCSRKRRDGIRHGGRGIE
jgi:hypothetical protein